MGVDDPISFFVIGAVVLLSVLSVVVVLVRLLLHSREDGDGSDS